MAKAKTYYAVREGNIAGQMTKKEGVYTVSKLSEDMEPLALYTVTETSAEGLICDCPAYKPWCRHMDILRKFQSEESLGHLCIGTGALWDHDHKKWVRE